MSRLNRVQMTIKREISNIIHHEIKDPRVGFVTVNRVELTKDLRLAKIFYSVLGKEEDYQNTKAALDSAAGFIRKLIAERIQLRFAPEITFQEDRSTEYSVRIQELLNEIEGLNKPLVPQKGKGKKPRPSQGRVDKYGKEGRGEVKKNRRLPKKK